MQTKIWYFTVDIRVRSWQIYEVPVTQNITPESKVVLFCL